MCVSRVEERGSTGQAAAGGWLYVCMCETQGKRVLRGKSERQEKNRGKERRSAKWRQKTARSSSSE